MDFIFQTRLTQSSDVTEGTVTLVADGKVFNEAVAVAAGATVNYTGMAGDPDNVVCYEILPTFGGTLTTTNSSGVADVVALVANKPLAWNNASGLVKHFANANPWTNWAFHNTDATDGTVKILIGRDDTP